MKTTTNTTKSWRKRVLLAALPLAAVTVGCLAAQDDMDAMLDGQVQERAWAGGHNVRIKLVSTRGQSIYENGMAQEDVWYVYEAARECAGHTRLDDLILPALFEEPIGIRMAADGEGTTDACVIEVPQGAEMLGEVDVQVQVTTNTEFGGLSVLNRVESEEACDRDGFFFEETESGEFGQISMCPTSCDTVHSAQESGTPIMIDVVLDEG